MNHKPYPKYKESGNEWLGELPENWDVKKITYLFKTISSGTTPKSDNPKFYESGIIPWVNTGDLNDSILDSCDKLVTELAIKEHSSLKQYEPGAIIFAMYGATIGKISILNFSATVNQACCVFADPQETITKFVFYWLFGFRKKIISLATGGGQPNISQDILRGLRLPYPTQQEQKSIATFLDRETSKLDILIREQKELITLLQEKRQALISNAVTKGLNPKAKMKDSGVEWLGEVPEHWEVKKLSYVASLKSGDQITSDDIDEEGKYPVYGGNGLRGYTPNFTHDGHFALIGRQGALCGNINYAIGKFWASEHAVVVNPKDEFNTNWIGELLREMNLNQYSTSAAQPGLSVEIISALKIVVPPLQEQNAISSFVENETKKIDALIQVAEETIDLMHEHRASLISEAVTGKIDVRKQV